MAGMGHKTWTRERLTADEVQGYLMDQVVAQFASASERDAFLGVDPADGWHVHLRDSGVTLVRVNSTWRQLVQPPGAWLTPSMGGRTNQGGTYPPMRYRYVPALNAVHVNGALSASAAAGVIFTIAETSLRPAYFQAMLATNGPAAAAQVSLAPNGDFTVAGTTGVMAINVMFPLD